MRRRFLRTSIIAGVIGLFMAVFAGSAVAALEVRSLEAQQIGSETAVLRGEVKLWGPNAQVGFEYGETTAYGAEAGAANIVGGSGWQYFEKHIYGLKSGTKYHFRAGAADSDEVAHGNDLTFTTPPFLEVKSLEAEALGPHSALLRGEVKLVGKTIATGFEYGETTAYGGEAESVFFQEGNGWTTFTKRITGLESDTEHHFRAVAVNARGASYGGDVTFITTQPIFDAQIYPADLVAGQFTSHGVSLGLEKGGSFSCEDFFLSGEMTSAGNTIALAPTFGECIVMGMYYPKIAVNGCTYVFEAEAGTSDSMGIDCPAGKAIEISMGTCTMTLPEQSGVGGVDAGLATYSVDNLKLDLSASSFKYVKTKDGFLCPFNGTGTMENGTYSGSVWVGGQYNEEEIYEEFPIDLGFVE